MNFIKIIAFLSIITTFGACSSNKEINKTTKDSVITLENYQLIADSANIKRFVRNLFVAASIAEMQGRFSDAIVDFTHVAKYDSSNIPYFAIAKCMYMINKPDLAIDYAIESYKRNSEFVPNLELLRELYQATNNQKSAMDVNEKLLRLNPNIENRKSYARNLETFDHEKAIKEHQKIYDETKDVETLVRLNSLYITCKDTINYVKSLNQIINLPEQNKSTLISLLYSHPILREYDSFVNTVKLAEKNLLSYDYEDYLNLALELFYNDSTGINSGAIPDVLAYINNKDLDNWRTYYLGAFIAEKSKDSLIMDRFYEKAILLNDSINTIPLQAAFANLRMQRYVMAISFLEKSAKKFPDDYSFPYYTSLAYLLLKNYEKSLEYANKAYYLNPDDFQTIYQNALVNETLKNKDSALKYYRLAYPKNQNNIELNNNYAYLLSELDLELEFAEKLSLSTLEIDPMNPSYLDTYGWIQYKLGNIDNAFEYINKAYEKANEAPDILEHLGDIYFLKKDKEKAIIFWEKSLNLNPNNKSLSEKILRSK